VSDASIQHDFVISGHSTPMLRPKQTNKRDQASLVGHDQIVYSLSPKTQIDSRDDLPVHQIIVRPYNDQARLPHLVIRPKPDSPTKMTPRSRHLHPQTIIKLPQNIAVPTKEAKVALSPRHRRVPAEIAVKPVRQ
jgi:hypothetical protein